MVFICLKHFFTVAVAGVLLLTVCFVNSMCRLWDLFLQVQLQCTVTVSKILISEAPDFSKLSITWSKSCFPSLVKHNIFTLSFWTSQYLNQFSFSLGGLNNQESTECQLSPFVEILVYVLVGKISVLQFCDGSWKKWVVVTPMIRKQDTLNNLYD